MTLISLKVDAKRGKRGSASVSLHVRETRTLAAKIRGGVSKARGNFYPRDAMLAELPGY